MFVVERERKRVERLFSLPQAFSVTRDFGRDSGVKSFSRGLRSVRVTGETLLISDVFGVYETDRHGRVKRYLSLPIFSDLHSALPSEDGSRVLVTSTGVEQILDVGWDGSVHQRIDVAGLFGLAPSALVVAAMKRHPDHRLIPFSSASQSFHCNWAQRLDGGRLLVSLFFQGMVAILAPSGEVAREGFTIEKSWSCFPRCHSPVLDLRRGTLVVASSLTDQVMEVDMESGRRIWTAAGIGFCKGVTLLDERRALVTDVNGRRLVELDRDTGREIWSCPLPGMPYNAAELPS